MERRDALLTGAAAVAAALVGVPAVPVSAAPAPIKRPYFYLPPMYLDGSGHTRIRDEQNNWITTIHHEICRIPNFNAREERWDFFKTQKFDYIAAILEDPGALHDGVPPHFGFGGCIVPRSVRDPAFYPRWQEHARSLWRTQLLRMGIGL